MKLMERRLGSLAEPYEKPGRTKRLGEAAKVLTAAGAGVMALAGRRRGAAIVAGAMVLAGSVCERWSVFKAGFDSAADPKYTVEHQRARIDGAGSNQSEPHPVDARGGEGDWSRMARRTRPWSRKFRRRAWEGPGWWRVQAAEGIGNDELSGSERRGAGRREQR